MRKDAASIMEDLSELDVELAISTNGILVDRFINTFKRSGIEKVNVSLDSINRSKQESISRRNYFDKILSNISLLLSHNFEVKINSVLLADLSEEEICGLISLGKEQQLAIRFIEFMPFRDNEWDWKNGISGAEVLEMAKKNFGKNNIEALAGKASDTSKNYRVKGFPGSFGIISTVTDPFCSGCNRLRLTADGKLKNCLFSPGESDLLSALRNSQALEPLILSNLMQKEKQRGGMESFEDFADPDKNKNNRSMIRIGG